MLAGSGPTAGRSGVGGPPVRGGGQTAVPGGSRSPTETRSSASAAGCSPSGGFTVRGVAGSVSPGRRRGPAGRSGASTPSSGVGSQPPTRIPVRAMSSSATDPPSATGGERPGPVARRREDDTERDLAEGISPRNSHACPAPAIPAGQILEDFRPRRGHSVPRSPVLSHGGPRPPETVGSIMKLAAAKRASKAANFMIDACQRAGGAVGRRVSGGCGVRGPGWGASSRSRGGLVGRPPG